jgi:hypothetical protein
LTAGGNYRLIETTTYSDGSSLISGVYRFLLNASGMVDNVDMEDRPVHLYFTKVDAQTGEELTGGRYSLIDAEYRKSVIYEFTREEGREVLIPAKLITPGKEYIIKEEQSSNWDTLLKKRSASRRRKAAYGQPSLCRIKKQK